MEAGITDALIWHQFIARFLRHAIDARVLALIAHRQSAVARGHSLITQNALAVATALGGSRADHGGAVVTAPPIVADTGLIEGREKTGLKEFLKEYIIIYLITCWIA